MRVAIVGAGLAGLSTAVELVDAGHEVEIFEARPFVGGKVGSWVDKDGNHIEMGLHVFFGCYYNLFSLMEKVGAGNNLRLKEHTHQFINEGAKLANSTSVFPSVLLSMVSKRSLPLLNFRRSTKPPIPWP